MSNPNEGNNISDLGSGLKATLANMQNRLNSIHTNPTNTNPSITVDPVKYLTKLPDFDGNTNYLQNFIDLVDRIHPILQSYDEFSQLIFSDILRSKFKGRAREVTEINYHLKSWTEIKALLCNNFGDRKSADQLFDELRSVTFKTNSQDFYNEIRTILRRLNIKTVHENNGQDPKLILQANITSALNI